MTRITSQTEAYIRAMKNRPRPARARGLALSIGAAVLVLAIGAVVWAYRKPAPPAIPPLDSDPIVLAKFTGTAAFDKLPEETRIEYMQKVGSQMPALMQAFRDKKITEEDAANAFDNMSAL